MKLKEESKIRQDSYYCYEDEDFVARKLKHKNPFIEMIYCFLDVACNNAKNNSSQSFNSELHFGNGKEFNSPGYYAAFTGAMQKIMPELNFNKVEIIKCKFCGKKLPENSFILSFNWKKTDYAINIPVMLHMLIEHNTNVDRTFVAMLSDLYMRYAPHERTYSEMDKNELIEIITQQKKDMDQLIDKMETLTRQVQTLDEINKSAVGIKENEEDNENDNEDYKDPQKMGCIKCGAEGVSCSVDSETDYTEYTCDDCDYEWRVMDKTQEIIPIGYLIDDPDDEDCPKCKSENTNVEVNREEKSYLYTCLDCKFQWKYNDVDSDNKYEEIGYFGKKDDIIDNKDNESNDDGEDDDEDNDTDDDDENESNDDDENESNDDDDDDDNEEDDTDDDDDSDEDGDDAIQCIKCDSENVKCENPPNRYAQFHCQDCDYVWRTVGEDNSIVKVGYMKDIKKKKNAKKNKKSTSKNKRK